MNAHYVTRRTAMLCGAVALLNARLSWAQSVSFRIGVAQTPVTPSWPTTLWGYDNITHYTNGVLDDIFAVRANAHD